MPNDENILKSKSIQSIDKIFLQDIIDKNINIITKSIYECFEYLLWCLFTQQP